MITICDHIINNVTMKDWGSLAHSCYLLHDRDGKFRPYR